MRRERVARVVFGAAALAVALGGLSGCGSSATKDSTVAETAAPDTKAAPATAAAAPDTTVAPDTSVAPDTTAAASSTVASRPPTTINVPADAPSIQAAVDRAVPGDLILIAPGTYHEAVDIKTPRITLRGLDRNTVILDGNDQLENGVLAAADGIAVENLTVRHFTFNGVLLTKAYDDNVDDPTQHVILQGYKVSYVTASNNGQYGVYAFFARGGEIDHVYASGHPDSGIYVGQCKPCDAVVHDVIAEQNSIGYEGTNSSGNLFIVNSTWRNNRIGLTPNSQDMERLAPQGDVVIAGNLVESNNSATAPATAQGAFGVGIAVAGGTSDHVLRNRIVGNVSSGVVVTDLNKYDPIGNEVRGNVLSGNGRDLVYVTSSGAGPVPARKNCFAENTFTSSVPDAIESVLPCASPVDTPVVTGPYAPVPPPPDVDYRTVALPPDQPNMPDAAAAPATIVSAAVPTLDISTISVPKGS